jgi:hypothetical protein
MRMRTWQLDVALACGLLIACGSQSRVDHASGKSGGGSSGACDSSVCGAGNGGTPEAGRAGAATGGATAGRGGGGTGGNAGVRGLDPAPPSCTTADGSPGISVDVFPPAGARLQCEALNQPGALDPDCPSDVFVECSIEDCYEAETLPGCCRPDGFCGLLDTGHWGRDVPLGCISKDEWIEHGEEVLNRSVVPVRCD